MDKRDIDKPVDDEPIRDEERNPDIGQSKGSFATGEDPELIEGENTVEGDVENDSTYGGGGDPSQLGRTNK
jgi:hypothetical protein